MDTNAAVAQAEEAVAAAVAAFAAVLAGGDVAVSGATGGPEAVGVAGAGVGFDDDPLQRVADGAMDVLAGVARSEAKLAALKAQAVAVFAGATKALNAPVSSPYEVAAQERSLVAEVGCVLVIGDRAAGALLADSHALTSSLPRTLAALQAGTVSWAHARTMIDQAASLDPAGAAALEAHFLDPDTPKPAAAAMVGEMPAYRFKAKARAWRERHHPESLEKRHAKSVADRRVEYWLDGDGMGWVAACLPADQASAIWDRLTTVSRGMQGPDETRTLTQLRADVAAGWLLGGTPTEIPAPRAQVLVTVPVFSLLGLTDEPAVLDGSGPIPASMARNLVGNGADSFYRVLVDPRDGAPLEIGRTSYRLTKAMRNWLRLRDGKCPFPGCSNNSLDNEADHILAWHQGGTTGISNLGQPCPKHHKLRHTSGWKPTPATTTEPPGWTSPTGRHYKSEHQDWEPPHWPTEVGVSLPRAVAAADVHYAGLQAADVPSARFQAADVLSAGFQVADVPSAGLQAADVLSAGFQAAELRAEDSALTYDPWVDIAPEDFITSDDLSPEEPRWEDVHDVPEVLPHGPFPGWELFLTSKPVLHV